MTDPENMGRVADAAIKDRLKTAIEKELLQTPIEQDLRAETAKFSQVSHIQDGLRLSDDGLVPTDDGTDEKISEFAERLMALRD
jgi:hypothetical protein